MTALYSSHLAMVIMDGLTAVHDLFWKHHHVLQTALRCICWH